LRSHLNFYIKCNDKTACQCYDFINIDALIGKVAILNHQFKHRAFLLKKNWLILPEQWSNVPRIVIKTFTPAAAFENKTKAQSFSPNSARDGRQSCRPAQRSRVTGLCYVLLAFWSHWNLQLGSCRIRRLGYLATEIFLRFYTSVRRHVGICVSFYELGTGTIETNLKVILPTN
jgi:hypothetical protein